MTQAHTAEVVHSPAPLSALSFGESLSRPRFKNRVEKAELRMQLVEWREEPVDGQRLRLITLRARNSRTLTCSVSVEDEAGLDKAVERISRGAEREAEMLAPAPFFGVVEAYFGEQTEPSQSLSLTLEREGGGEGGGYGGDFSGSRDALQAMTKIAVRALDRADAKDLIMERVFMGVIKHSTDMIASANTRSEAAQDKFLEVFVQLQTALDAREDRQDRAAERAARAELIAGVVEALKTAGPIIANRVLFKGEQVLPEPTSGPMLMFQRLYEVLEAEDIGKIAMALQGNPQGMALLGELMTTIQDARDKAVAKAARVAEEKEKAEAEAAAAKEKSK